jgi:hypothetical protein
MLKALIIARRRSAYHRANNEYHHYNRSAGRASFSSEVSYALFLKRRAAELALCNAIRGN